jgi:hypothetical protein
LLEENQFPCREEEEETLGYEQQQQQQLESDHN